MPELFESEPIIDDAENKEENPRKYGEQLQELKRQIEIRLGLLSWSQLARENYHKNDEDRLETQTTLDAKIKKIVEGNFSQLPEDERLILLEEMSKQAQGQLSGARIETERTTADRVIIRLYRTEIGKNNKEESEITKFVYDASNNHVLSKENIEEEAENAIRNTAINLMVLAQFKLGQHETDDIVRRRIGIEATMKKVPSKVRTTLLENSITRAQGQLSGGRLKAIKINEGRLKIQLVRIENSGRESLPLVEFIYDQSTNQFQIKETTR